MQSNYVHVEWVGLSQNSNINYINTNFVPTIRTKIKAKLIIANVTTSTISTIIGNNEVKLYVNPKTVDGYWHYFLSWKYGQSTTVAEYDYSSSYNIFNIEAGNNYLKINDVIVSELEQNTVQTYFSPINIFGNKSETNYRPVVRIYELQIYDGDKLVVNLVPAKNTFNDTLGFYDTVSDMFLVNEGVNTLNCGSILEPIEISDVTRTGRLNLELYSDQKSLMKNYLNSLNSNSKKIDNTFLKIQNKNQTLSAKKNNINQTINNDAAQKTLIWNELDSKVTFEEGKSLLINALLAKLAADYSNLDLDNLFATNVQFRQLIDSICDSIMQPYYTKAEVDEKIVQGEAAQMDDYYTKIQIEDLIPEKEDLSMVYRFLENQRIFQENLVLFTRLNGLSE